MALIVVEQIATGRLQELTPEAQQRPLASEARIVFSTLGSTRARPIGFPILVPFSRHEQPEQCEPGFLGESAVHCDSQG